MAIIRTYKRDEESVLHFREAWYETFENEELGQFVVNHGVVGHMSKTEEAKDVDDEAGTALLAAFGEQCTEDGFVALTPEEQDWVVIQYALKSDEGTERDRRLRDTAIEALTGHLAWRGLGTVESSDFAPRKLNIRILSPEVNKCVSAIKTCLREGKFDFTKLTIAAAPYGDPEAFKQKHPMPAKGTFSLV